MCLVALFNVIDRVCLAVLCLHIGHIICDWVAKGGLARDRAQTRAGSAAATSRRPAMRQLGADTCHGQGHAVLSQRVRRGGGPSAERASPAARRPSPRRPWPGPPDGVEGVQKVRSARARPVAASLREVPRRAATRRNRTSSTRVFDAPLDLPEGGSFRSRHRLHGYLA